MNGLKQDMVRIQELIGTAFTQTGCLVALSDGGMMSPEKLQQTLEQTMEHFERSALELRRLCEQYSPGVGGYGNRARARLVIDEHSSIGGRHVFDQDNKGWKAVSNALKGWVIEDDDQYTLNLALVSKMSKETACHITLLEQRDAADFFSLRSGDHGFGCLYDGL